MGGPLEERGPVLSVRPRSCRCGTLKRSPITRGVSVRNEGHARCQGSAYPGLVYVEGPPAKTPHLVPWNPLLITPSMMGATMSLSGETRSADATIPPTAQGVIYPGHSCRPVFAFGPPPSSGRAEVLGSASGPTVHSSSPNGPLANPVSGIAPQPPAAFSVALTDRRG